MNSRGLTLLTLAALALLLYFIGFKTGTVVVIIIAAVVELWFWLNLAMGDQQNEPPDK